MTIRPVRRKCPICGKDFVTMNAKNWVYKKSKVFFCSWKCVRIYEEQNRQKGNNYEMPM